MQPAIAKWHYKRFICMSQISTFPFASIMYITIQFLVYIQCVVSCLISTMGFSKLSVQVSNRESVHNNTIQFLVYIQCWVSCLIFTIGLGELSVQVSNSESVQKNTIQFLVYIQCGVSCLIFIMGSSKLSVQVSNSESVQKNHSTISCPYTMRCPMSDIHYGVK